MDKKFKQLNTIVAACMGLLVILFVGWWISTSNRINDERQDCDEQWSQVENVMQRRYDLIPNLTASVKGSMKQEQKVFGQIATARSQYNSATTRKQKMVADSKLDRSTRTLINVIDEKYPKLESNANIQSLMLELSGSENRIAIERQNYIAAVRAYNQTVNNFPSSIVANTKGAKPMHYFKASSQAQQAPRVDLP